MNRLICLILGHRKPVKPTATIRVEHATRTTRVLCCCTRCGKGVSWAIVTGVPDSVIDGTPTPEAALAGLLAIVLERMLEKIGKEPEE